MYFLVSFCDFSCFFLYQMLIIKAHPTYTYYKVSKNTQYIIIFCPSSQLCSVMLNCQCLISFYFLLGVSNWNVLIFLSNEYAIIILCHQIHFIDIYFIFSHYYETQWSLLWEHISKLLCAVSVRVQIICTYLLNVLPASLLLHCRCFIGINPERLTKAS